LITKNGDLKINNDITLYDVLVVPKYTVSLLSIHKLSRDSKFFVGFDEGNYYIQYLKANRTVGIGKQFNGFYLFDVDNACKIVSNNCISTCFVSKTLWHQRLGHHADQVLDALKTTLNLDSHSTSDHLCDTCNKAKQTKEPFPLSDHKSSKIGELVHLDVWGPYKVISRDGFRLKQTEFDSGVTKDLNHKNVFDNENPKRPNDEGRVSSNDDDTELGPDIQLLSVILRTTNVALGWSVALASPFTFSTTFDQSTRVTYLRNEYVGEPLTWPSDGAPQDSGISLQTVLELGLEVFSLNVNDHPLNIVFTYCISLSIYVFDTYCISVMSVWDWRRPIRDGLERVQLYGLNNLLLHFVPSSLPNSWEFGLNESRCFTVSAMRKHIESFTLSTDAEKIRWNNLIPIKLNILTWRISLDHIPTRSNLDSRGIDLDSILCPVCNDEIKTSKHLLIDCSIAKSSWILVSNGGDFMIILNISRP
ncbi:ribonuclease H-like domain-containing protein, partial [Tanacetum coccineum]